MSVPQDPLLLKDFEYIQGYWAMAALARLTTSCIAYPSPTLEAAEGEVGPPITHFIENLKREQRAAADEGVQVPQLGALLAGQVWGMHKNSRSMIEERLTREPDVKIRRQAAAGMG